MNTYKVYATRYEEGIGISYAIPPLVVQAPLFSTTFLGAHLYRHLKGTTAMIRVWKRLEDGSDQHTWNGLWTGTTLHTIDEKGEDNV